jgi:hypothetical protein
VIVLVAILLVLVQHHNRRSRKSALENSGQQTRFIPLQDMNFPFTQNLHPKEQQNVPLSARSRSEGDLGYPFTSPPVARPPPSYTFGATIRAYASESRSDNNLVGRERSAEETGTLTRSLSRMERLIMERIRTTGRPDIPISATPKIMR